MVARILIVEDNPVQSRLMEMYLRDQYETVTTDSGETCLEILAKQSFDLLLLDVGLPGINGYDVCRQIKENEAYGHLPVIFLSASIEQENRLKGFEVGAFDYLNKPVAREELITKIGHLISYQDEKRNLQQSAQFASATAMTAMSSAAEQGLVLQFMQRSFNCQNPADLAKAIFETCRQLGLNTLLQLRVDNAQACNFSSNGACSPLEESILSHLSQGPRLTDLGNRTAIWFEQVTLIVLNMPREDAEHYGRLKDNLVMLSESINARMNALNIEHQMSAQLSAQTQRTTAHSHELLQLVAAMHGLYRESHAITDRLAHNLHDSIGLLELTPRQEEHLDDLVSDTTINLHDVESRADALHARIGQIAAQISAKNE